MNEQLLFLGTGAAQGIPAAYCRCTHCEYARRVGGRERRTRSALRVGDKHQIDAGPDTYSQMLLHGVDMYDIEHVLITHSHGDHLQIESILDKTMSEDVNGRPISIYLSSPAKRVVEQMVEPILDQARRTRVLQDFRLVAVEYFEPFTAGDLKVEALEGNHSAWGQDERSINYLITLPGGGTVLYALDTGYYGDETWEYLAGRRGDIVIMDCTFGGSTTRDEYPDGHLHIPSFVHMLEKMTAIGFAGTQTRVYASHVNPHHGLNHEQMQQRFDEGPFEVTVAYDGLVIEV